MRATSSRDRTPRRAGAPALRRGVMAALLALLAATARAQGTPPCTLTVASTITIAASDLTHDLCTIVVNSGGTLTVLGPHSFASLIVNSGGTVTSASLDSLTLSVSGDVTVAAGGRVRVDGRGHPSGLGPGAGVGGVSSSGGSHGGRGGAVGTNTSGLTYDMFEHPELLGSGGGPDVSAGGAGGGAIRLVVGGTLSVSGEMTARGDSAIGVSASFDPGGGAGGSIGVWAATLAGGGAIDAGGGRGANLGGGGGGGRVALEFVTNTFIGVTRAAGGRGSAAVGHGGAGTIWSRVAGAPQGTLIIDNGGLGSLRAAEFVDSVVTVPGSLVVRGAGIVSGALSRTLTLNVLGDATIEAGAAFSVDGRGYGAAQGPGAGVGGTSASGGSHGGRGGWVTTTGSGPTYDSITQPLLLGSGGGSEVSAGGRGGGAVRFIVTGALTLNGELSARGDSAIASGPSFDPGGGAGGSVWATAASFAGSGTIDVTGGRGANLGGGGGGGRMVLEYAASTFSGALKAYGGPGSSSAGHGAAGTSWLRDTDLALGELRVDNGGLVTLRAAELTDSNTIVSGTLVVKNGGIVSGPLGRTLTITVLGDATVDAGAAISVDGRGHAAAQGPGAGVGGTSASGASHGGRGGAGASQESGPTYDDFMHPALLGSGGGSEVSAGGRGGGALRLIVSGVLRVEGELSARGDSALSVGGTFDPAGGAGGSVWASAASLAGAGAIDVKGGRGANLGAGGGGGRASLEYGASTFTGALRAAGGIGPSLTGHGGAGTVWLRDTDVVLGELIVDNGGLLAEAAAELVDSNTTVPGTVRVRGRGVLATPKRVHMHVVVQGDAIVEADGAISMAGRGYLAGTGPGAGVPGTLPSGGSHGGRGGGGTTNPSGPTYDSAAQPVDFGSGGASDVIAGGAGGGAMRLEVAGTLRVDGAVSTRGQTAVAPAGAFDPAGGAGGSLWMDANVVTGSGSIDASGGDGANLGGGGGGGRIALHSLCFDGFSAGQIRVAGGRGLAPAAGVGTIVPDLARGVAAGVIATSGDAHRHAVPVSLADDALQDADSLWTIVERGDLLLSSPVPIEISAPGVVSDPGGFTPAALDSGLYVNVHVLHFDPPVAGARARGSVTFDTNVLGVIATDGALVATDGVLRSPGMVYPSSPARGAEFAGAEADTVELSADRRTVTFSAGVLSGTDEIRIVTAVPLTSCGAIAGVDEGGAHGSKTIVFAPPAPNPSRGAVRLNFTLPSEQQVRLDVIDVAGRRVATLIDGRVAAGQHAFEWRPGAGARAGVYFARLTNREGTWMHTVVRIR